MSDSKCDVTSNSCDGQPIVYKTASVVRSYNIQWEISNFNFLVKTPGQFLQMGPFTTGTNPQKEWIIKLYPNGYSTAGHVAVYLCNNSRYLATVEFTFAILDTEQAEYLSLKYSKILMQPASELGFPQFISLEKLKNEELTLLPEGTLTIRCNLRVLDLSENSCLNKVNSVDNLSEDYIKLLTSPEWSDFTISAGGKIFPVHKTVLVARSPIFALMFKNNMEESKSNTVEITDIQPDVMEELLFYIYTGKCSRINEMAMELIHAAEKYDLSGLKDLCEAALIEQLSVENAADVLTIAVLYNRIQLKSRTLDFINKHAKEVFVSNSWKNMGASHPDIENEGLRAMTIQPPGSLLS